MNSEDIFMIGFFLCLFIISIICLVGGIFLNGVGGSAGEHTGIITAVEHNINLLWDADIIYFKSSDESTQEDIYCIDKGIIKLAKQKSKNKEIVTIRFENNFWFWRADCNGGISIIKEIKR